MRTPSLTMQRERSWRERGPHYPQPHAPGVPKLLIWDNAPQTASRTEAAEAAAITLAFLPFRAPELMPLEELWRGLKATVVANRCYPTLEDLTQHAIDWLDAMTKAERLHRCGFQSSKFDWLPT